MEIQLWPPKRSSECLVETGENGTTTSINMVKEQAHKQQSLQVLMLVLHKLYGKL